MFNLFSHKVPDKLLQATVMRLKVFHIRNYPNIFDNIPALNLFFYDFLKITIYIVTICSTVPIHKKNCCMEWSRNGIGEI